ncbi:hypothetical protein HS125_16700 [bacterium]|nr:hypothetical protein [bacterium]
MKMSLFKYGIVLAMVVGMAAGPAFAQRPIGDYATADKATTAVESGSGSIALSYAAVSYKAGTTFTRMTEGTYPEQFMAMHRPHMRQMCTLVVKGADYKLCGVTIAPGTYKGGFDIAEPGKWTMIFMDGDKEIARIPVIMQKGETASPSLVIALLPTAKGQAGVMVCYGPNCAVVTEN